MRNLFLYGTLRHIPLLEIVLGREAQDIQLAPARLPGFGVSGIAEGPCPTLVRDPDAAAEGLLIEQMTDEDFARLDFYLGSLDYDVSQGTLADGSHVEFFAAPPGRWTPSGGWSLREWIAGNGAAAVHAAAEVMRYFGSKSRDEVAAMLPRIRARAASKVRAATSRHGARTLMGEAEVLGTDRAYAKFFLLDDLTIRHQRFGGWLTGPIERAAFIASDATILLPYDPHRDRVLLVEQIRVGPLARGDRAVWQLEPIAGIIDAGETPQEAARREAQEEAGLSLAALEPVAEVYCSPGNSTEFYYIFVGLADLPDDIIGTGGLDAEHEDIRSHLMSFDELMAFVDTFDAANAPLVLTALWLARHRDRLRSQHRADTP